MYPRRAQEKPPNGTFPAANSIATQAAGASNGHARSRVIRESATPSSPHHSERNAISATPTQTPSTEIQETVSVLAARPAT